jgi:hypothetical protein
VGHHDGPSSALGGHGHWHGSGQSPAPRGWGQVLGDQSDVAGFLLFLRSLMVGPTLGHPLVAGSSWRTVSEGARAAPDGGCQGGGC